MNRKDKYERYRYLMPKLDKALKNEFYYEAIFIEYAIIEDRTESMLKHAKIKYLDNDGKSLKLHKKLNKLNSNKMFKDKYTLKHLSNELIDKIYLWKDKRNKLIHNLINTSYTNDDIKNIALEGNDIIRIINNKSTLINRYFDKIYMKED